jgi:hypothetical protein
VKTLTFKNKSIHTGQNILFAILGESNCNIAVLALKAGVGQSEATAFAFVDRSIGNAYLESLEVADLCQQGTYALPSLDFVNN